MLIALSMKEYKRNKLVGVDLQQPSHDTFFIGHMPRHKKSKRRQLHGVATQATMGSMLFCLQTEEEKELLERRSKSTNDATAKQFLDELVIFSVAEPEARESPSQGSLKRESSSSASSKESSHKKEEVLWKEALDPRSGKTYYYHVVTRKTTWHKPDELRAYEKRLKQEKRRQDKLFFQEMERNIYASLEKKEVVPGVEQECIRLPTTPADETPSIPATKQRVRTISGMDEALLAQLKIGPKPIVAVASAPTPASALVQQKNKPVSTSTAPADLSGRPPLPVRRHSSREASIDHSYSLSPEECENKSPDLLERHDSDAGAELAGEKLLDAPINENVKLGDGEGSVAVIQKVNHVRRNTGGTIYVKSTMTNPDIKATIKCVCGVYRAHILQAAEKSASSSPVSVASHSKDGLAQVFLDEQFPLSKKDTASPSDVPSLQDVMAFYEMFYERSQMEIDTVIMSLIYVERLMKETNGLIVPTGETWKSILFSCMVLASKVWDDLSMWNVDFSNVAGRNYVLSSFTLRRINDLELALLKCLNFIVRVPASEYAKYYFLIRSMLIKSGNLREGGEHDTSNVPLDLKEAKKLETLSANYQAAVATGQEDANSRRSRSLNDHDFDSLRDVKKEPSPTGNKRQSVCLEQLVTMNR